MGKCEDCTCSPKTLKDAPGTKHDHGKARVDLIDPLLMLSAAKGLEFGLKYGEHNWRKGMQWSRIYGGLLRHLFAFWQREDIDEESGNHHLDHAACMLMFLIRYAKDKNYAEHDDRYRAVMDSTFFLEEVEIGPKADELESKADAILGPSIRFPQPKPVEPVGVRDTKQERNSGSTLVCDPRCFVEPEDRITKSFTCLTCIDFALPVEGSKCGICIFNGQKPAGSVDYYADCRKASGVWPKVSQAEKERYRNEM
jgi:hypothetical protein